jgi:hypothetical protein
LPATAESRLAPVILGLEARSGSSAIRAAWRRTAPCRVSPVGAGSPATEELRLASVALGLEARSGSSAFRAALRAPRVTFLFLSKERQPKERRPVSRLPGILPCRYAFGLRGFADSASCAGRTLAHPCARPCGPCYTPARRRTGAPSIGHPGRTASGPKHSVPSERALAPALDSRVPSATQGTDIAKQWRRVSGAAFSLVTFSWRSRESDSGRLQAGSKRT